MRKTFWAVLSAITLTAAASPAFAEDLRPQLDQDVFKSSAPIRSMTIGTAFSQVDSPKLDGSFFVEVQNLSTEQVCCAFDSGASSSPGAGRACVRIDTASSATVARPNDWKRWKRWAQNLSLYCRTLKIADGSTAEIIVTQGK